ncbi:hypothetical protein N7535_009209 [Penicillium sp. DV-2018c]|nr:hypothetical protein N7461_002889 [Penicillium sp. DV-2018c]KAJ5561012.1 hypothetical protein N7535_009209 [Penicillium sp. DV-2018c]
MTDTQGEAPLYTQSTSTQEPPLPVVTTPLPTDIQHVEEENEKLRTVNIQLCNEGNRLKRSQDEQVARLHAVDDALDEVRGRLINVLKVWNERSAGDLAILLEDGFP